jgi:hypothetical protein
MLGGYVSSTRRIRWRGWWEVSSVSSTEQKQTCWKLGVESLPFVLNTSYETFSTDYLVFFVLNIFHQTVFCGVFFLCLQNLRI